jgi:hypothetical protein
MRWVRMLSAVVALLFALLVALPLSGFSAWAVWSLAQPRPLHPSEVRDIQPAAEFIDTFRSQHARLPVPAEFDAWTERMDARDYSYSGWGYSLQTACSTKEWDYCLSFWSGDAWMEYRSWERDKKVAHVADQGGWLLMAIASIAAALGLIALSVRLFRR